MQKRATPGSLALFGLGALVLSPVVAFAVGWAGMNPPMWALLVLPTVGALLVIGAGVAKVIQIGVRTAKD